MDFSSADVTGNMVGKKKINLQGKVKIKAVLCENKRF